MNHALIFAGGVGARMHSKSLPKQFLLVHGRPIIVHTLEHFQDLSEVDNVVVVCTRDWISHMKELVAKFRLDKVTKVVPGGKTALESQRIGLRAIEHEGAAPGDLVLIHDGVRPLIDEDTIRSCLLEAGIHGSAATIAPATETIARLDELGDIASTVERSECVLARAPQTFRLGEILAAHERAEKEGLEFVDSASMMIHFGHKVHAVKGTSENIKVTTPADYFICRALLDARESEQVSGL